MLYAVYPVVPRFASTDHKRCRIECASAEPQQLHVSLNTQNTLCGVGHLCDDQPVCRNPHREDLGVFSQQHNKGGVGGGYPRHMESANRLDFLASVASTLAGAMILSKKEAAMQLTTVYDCMGSNLGKFLVPAGVQLAGYITGSGDVPWTRAQLAEHPGVIQIDQAPANTPANELADVIDMEQDAATLNDLIEWVHAAANAWTSTARAGQRRPTVYCSSSNLTPVANTLVAAGITEGVNLWVAEPMTVQQATAMLNSAGGPFPIVGVQYAFEGLYDISLFSTAWLDDVSGKPPTTKPGPGTQAGWRFCSKCQGLFWGPGQAISVCPRGAQHDGGSSHEYTLGFVV